MSAKFTNSKKWDDVWFSQLTMKEKVMFMYLCDTCDIAGFREINKPLATLQTGIEDIDGTIEALSKSVVYNDGYIWIKKYIKHQKNLPINPKNGAHIAIANSMRENVYRFPEVFEYLPVSDGEKLKQMINTIGVSGKGGKAPLSPPPPPSPGIGNGSIKVESKIAKLYKYFVGEKNLMGDGITGGTRKILAEAIQVMEPEEWKPYCEARLKDEFKASPNKFFLEDGWRRYQDNVKSAEVEESSRIARRKDAEERLSMPDTEAPDDFKKFVKDLRKR